jgi:hypothetical protein
MAKEGQTNTIVKEGQTNTMAKEGQTNTMAKKGQTNTIAEFLVLYVCFVDHCLSFFPFSFLAIVFVCPSLAIVSFFLTF